MNMLLRERRFRCIVKFDSELGETYSLIKLPGNMLILARSMNAPLLVNADTGTVSELSAANFV